MSRRVLVLSLSLLMLGVLAAPAAAHPAPLFAASALPGQTSAQSQEPAAQTAGLPFMTGSSRTAGRPAVTAEPTGPADRFTAPTVLVNADMAAASMPVQGYAAPLIVPREKLPFGFHVERQVANRFGLDTAVASLRQWDGIAGSRWATTHAGVVEERVSAAAVDGRSLLFEQASCPAGVGGYAY